MASYAVQQTGVPLPLNGGSSPFPDVTCVCTVHCHNARWLLGVLKSSNPAKIPELCNMMTQALQYCKCLQQNHTLEGPVGNGSLVACSSLTQQTGGAVTPADQLICIPLQTLACDASPLLIVTGPVFKLSTARPCMAVQQRLPLAVPSSLNIPHT